MQTHATIQTENQLLVFKYDEMKKVNYEQWVKLYDNIPISFTIKDNIILISDSMNVTFKDNDNTVTVTLEECQRSFQRYYNNLSNSKLMELLKNSFC
jgi:ketopantoate hydroxymethyltransferase